MFQHDLLLEMIDHKLQWAGVSLAPCAGGKRCLVFMYFTPLKLFVYSGLVWSGFTS